jgi:hypothetical protein
MFGEVLVVGGLAAVLMGLRQRWQAEEMPDESAIRQALRGQEAAGVRAEFRGRGVQAPERRVNVIPFGWN